MYIVEEILVYRRCAKKKKFSVLSMVKKHLQAKKKFEFFRSSLTGFSTSFIFGDQSQDIL